MNPDEHLVHLAPTEYSEDDGAPNQTRLAVHQLGCPRRTVFASRLPSIGKLAHPQQAQFQHPLIKNPVRFVSARCHPHRLLSSSNGGIRAIPVPFAPNPWDPHGQPAHAVSHLAPGPPSGAWTQMKNRPTRKGWQKSCQRGDSTRGGKMSAGACVRACVVQSVHDGQAAADCKSFFPQFKSGCRLNSY